MSYLEVTIIAAQNLKKMDLLSESDGFVEIYLNRKSEKYRTRVIYNCQNPQWNETVILNHFKGQDTLYVNVYDEDTLQNDEIGSFTIDLKDLYEKRYIENWYDIRSSSYEESTGKLHLKIKYETSGF